MRAVLLLLVPFFAPQDPPKGHPKVDQNKVDEAIARGAKYLLQEIGRLSDVNHPRAGAIPTDELVLYTLIHASVDQNDPGFQSLVDKLLTKELTRTYSVSMMACALEALNRNKYQYRIAQCAQFLVDNQCDNGQWDYGEPVPLEKKEPPPKDVATGGGTGAKTDGSGKASGSTKVTKKVPVRRRGKGRPAGDNSNSQYAALGLRACLQAGIDLPTATLADALKWWEGNQGSDGGWGYGEQGMKDQKSHGSMTAGAAGCCIIYRYYLRQEYKNDKSVKSGLTWIANNFTVKENPRYMNPGTWVYYWLYALERVGILYGTEIFGAHEWYPVGCEFLFAAQRADGSWMHNPPSLGGTIADTCFAILFLRRATKPLPPPVATGGGRR